MASICAEICGAYPTAETEDLRTPYLQAADMAGTGPSPLENLYMLILEQKRPSPFWDEGLLYDGS